jgi:flagellar protein FlbD
VITLHKLNGDEFVLNADLIISVEANPDTLISMVDRRTTLVRESAVDVVGAVIDYRRSISCGSHLLPVAGGMG